MTHDQIRIAEEIPPESFRPEPNIVTPRYGVAAGRLHTVVTEAQFRTIPQDHYHTSTRRDYLVRSAAWNFPDLATVQVNPDSTLVILSRSVCGHSDLGADRKRVAWVTAIDQRPHLQ